MSAERGTADKAATPLWMVSDLVTRVDAEGRKTVDTTLLPEIERLIIEGYFETKAEVEAKKGASPGGCSVCSDKPIAEHRNIKPRNTFADYVRGARAIYRGRATAIATGFYRGAPASLQRIDLHRELFRAPEVDPFGTAFVRLNVGRVPFGDDVICLCDMTFPALPPAPGSEVLLFVFFDVDRYLDLEGTSAAFFGLDAVEMILFTPTTGLRTAERLKDDSDVLAAQHLDDLEAMVIETLHGEAGPKH